MGVGTDGALALMHSAYLALSSDINALNRNRGYLRFIGKLLQVAVCYGQLTAFNPVSHVAVR